VTAIVERFGEIGTDRERLLIIGHGGREVIVILLEVPPIVDGFGEIRLQLQRPIEACDRLLRSFERGECISPVEPSTDVTRINSQGFFEVCKSLFGSAQV
jgi:hypothetical protein